MARAVGISYTSVQNIWREHGLKPHLVDTFKVSNDPAFAEKVEDVVGLYLDPPDKAVVFSVDEKSQIQALDRTQPGLPIKKGRAGTMTHDYKRNGTTTLFAALNVLDGKVIGQCMKRHRHQEFIRFLNRIDRQTLRIPGHSPDHRQLRRPQDTGGQTVAEKTPSLPHPLHANVASLARRALLRRDHPKRHPRGAFKSLAGWSKPSTTISPKNPVSLRLDRNRQSHSRKAARAKQTLETVRAGTKC